VAALLDDLQQHQAEDAERFSAPMHET
jgi:hypothetical protein